MLGQEWSFDQDLGTVSISLVGLEKHSRPKNLRSKITVENGPPGLQVKFCLKEFSKKFLNTILLQVKPVIELYLERTAANRTDNSRLFIGLVKPFTSVKSTTIRNIFVSAMEKAEIDTQRFKPHSSRSSATAGQGLTLKAILQLGCWKNSSTYHRYYEASVEAD